MKNKLNAVNRLKKRYLLIDAESIEIVEKAILDYIGILGFAKAKVQFLKEKQIILVVERKELANVRAAIEISSSNIKIKGVSGTLKGLEKYRQKI